MPSLFRRAKAVGNYIAERREADRYQPEGWETAEGRALLSQYRAEATGRAPVSRGVARVVHRAPGGVPANEIARRTAEDISRHGSIEVAVDTDHRPRHDGTQAQVGSGYLLTRSPTSRHGAAAEPDMPRVLTVNIVRAPDGSPLAGAIVTIALFADCAREGLLPESTIDGPGSTIDGVARIITPEEGELIAGWTPDPGVVPMRARRTA
jgi:hypothetical protein